MTSSSPSFPAERECALFERPDSTPAVACGVYLAELEDVPGHDLWLGSRELDVLSRLTSPKRRQEWRLGRWAAHSALTAAGVLGAVEVLAEPSGAPVAWCGAARADVVLSLSHRGRWACAAVGPLGAPLGCDLELLRPRRPSFVRRCFTPAEQEWMALCSGSLKLNLAFSAKEAALKAERIGLRRDPRSVELTRADESQGWARLSVLDHATGRVHSGWWCHSGEWVLAIAGALGTEPPTWLNGLRA